MDIPTILKDGMKRKSISQKMVAINNHFTRATASNYLKPGYQIPKDEAITIAKSIDDYPTKMNVAFALLGTLPMLNGSRVSNSAIGAKSFADIEEKEEKAKYSDEEIARILGSSREDVRDHMSRKDIDKLRKWIDEYLDEILMEVMVFNRSCDLIGVSQTDIINERLKLYVKERYMKEDKQHEKNYDKLHHQNS